MALHYLFEAPFFCPNFTTIKYHTRMSKKFWVISYFAIIVFGACGNSGEKTIGDFKTGDATTASAAENIFKEKCSMCHNINEDKIGPALAGTWLRWGKDAEKLKAFIKNSQAYINTGDPYATKLYEKWNRSNMPAFPNLTDKELDALVEYVQ
jgi:mono/diheme cytochrome c family protein